MAGCRYCKSPWRTGQYNPVLKEWYEHCKFGSVWQSIDAFNTPVRHFVQRTRQGKGDDYTYSSWIMSIFMINQRGHEHPAQGVLVSGIVTDAIRFHVNVGNSSQVESSYERLHPLPVITSNEVVSCNPTHPMWLRHAYEQW